MREVHVRDRRPALFALIAALLLLGGASCGVFDTRTPEDPGTGRAVHFRTNTQPDSVIQNLKTMIDSLASDRYGEWLDPDFTYTPPPGDEVLGGYLIGWNRVREEDAITSLVGTCAANRYRSKLSWVAGIVPQVSGDSAWYPNLAYSFEFKRTVTVPGASADTTFVGIVQLEMRLVSNLWTLTRWVDREDPVREGLTSGYLRKDKAPF